MFINRKHTEETKEKMRGKHVGKQNPQWKGDSVGYKALHNWVKRNLVKPQTCHDCNQPKPLDLANISQEYKRDISDWEWLCRSCHMKKDGRLAALQLSRRNHKRKEKAC